MTCTEVCCHVFVTACGFVCPVDIAVFPPDMLTLNRLLNIVLSCLLVSLCTDIVRHL